MNGFQALQASFQTALLQDQPLSSGLLLPRGDRQFGVYLNAYRARLRSALRDNYEALPLVMGDEAFDALANAYIAAQPSTHYSLRWFGHQLAAFMATHEALVDHPAMVDLARLEWALRRAFDAAQATPLSREDLLALSPQEWPTLCLGLHPSVHWLPLQWAVGPVWHALKAGQEEVPAPEVLSHHLLVWREGMQTRWQSLTDAQSVFVQGLQAGHPFGHICEILADQVGEDQAAATAVAVLRELLANGVISALQTAADVGEPNRGYQIDSCLRNTIKR